MSSSDFHAPATDESNHSTNESSSGSLKIHTQPGRSPQQISRRRFLLGSGAGILVLAAGGTIWRAEDQGVFSTGQGPAYQPWYDWQAPVDGPLNLIRAAILAANPHNTQPWLFRVTDTHIDMLADRTRTIGTIDPLLREMHIGLGCALENLSLAAEAQGYTPAITILPDAGNANYIASISLATGSANKSPLHEAIPHRHTNRYPYDLNHTVSTDSIESLQGLNDNPDISVQWFMSSQQRSLVADHMISAAKAIAADQSQDLDSGHWYRATWQDIQSHRDGITLDAQGLPDWQRTLGKILPPLSQDTQNQYFISNTEQQAKTAPVLGIIIARNRNDNSQRLRGGRLWQRMHLWATSHGLAMQPMNQMAERADREATLGLSPTFGNILAQIINDPSWQALMPFRLGYSTHTALLSPRRALKDILIS